MVPIQYAAQRSAGILGNIRVNPGPDRVKAGQCGAADWAQQWRNALQNGPKSRCWLPFMPWRDARVALTLNVVGDVGPIRFEDAAQFVDGFVVLVHAKL